MSLPNRRLATRRSYDNLRRPIVALLAMACGACVGARVLLAQQKPETPADQLRRYEESVKTRSTDLLLAQFGSMDLTAAIQLDLIQRRLRERPEYGALLDLQYKILREPSSHRAEAVAGPTEGPTIMPLPPGDDKARLEREQSIELIKYQVDYMRYRSDPDKYPEPTPPKDKQASIRSLDNLKSSITGAIPYLGGLLNAAANEAIFEHNDQDLRDPKKKADAEQYISQWNSAYSNDPAFKATYEKTQQEIVSHFLTNEFNRKDFERLIGVQLPASEKEAIELVTHDPRYANLRELAVYSLSLRDGKAQSDAQAQKKLLADSLFQAKKIQDQYIQVLKQQLSDMQRQQDLRKIEYEAREARSAISIVAQLAGLADKQVGHAISVIGGSAVSVAEGIDTIVIAKSVDISSLNTIVSGLIGLGGLFDGDSDAERHRQIMEALGQIFNEVIDVHKEVLKNRQYMAERFDSVDEQLSNIEDNIFQGFKGTLQGIDQIQVTQRQMATTLELVHKDVLRNTSITIKGQYEDDRNKLSSALRWEKRPELVDYILDVTANQEMIGSYLDPEDLLNVNRSTLLNKHFSSMIDFYKKLYSIQVDRSQTGAIDLAFAKQSRNPVEFVDAVNGYLSLAFASKNNASTTDLRNVKDMLAAAQALRMDLASIGSKSLLETCGTVHEREVRTVKANIVKELAVATGIVANIDAKKRAQAILTPILSDEAKRDLALKEIITARDDKQVFDWYSAALKYSTFDQREPVAYLSVKLDDSSGPVEKNAYDIAVDFQGHFIIHNTLQKSKSDTTVHADNKTLSSFIERFEKIAGQGGTLKFFGRPLTFAADFKYPFDTSDLEDKQVKLKADLSPLSQERKDAAIARLATQLGGLVEDNITVTWHYNTDLSIKESVAIVFVNGKEKNSVDVYARSMGSIDKYLSKAIEDADNSSPVFVMHESLVEPSTFVVPTAHVNVITKPWVVHPQVAKFERMWTGDYGFVKDENSTAFLSLFAKYRYRPDEAVDIYPDNKLGNDWQTRKFVKSKIPDIADKNKALSLEFANKQIGPLSEVFAKHCEIDWKLGDEQQKNLEYIAKSRLDEKGLAIVDLTEKGYAPSAGQISSELSKLALADFALSTLTDNFWETSDMKKFSPVVMTDIVEAFLTPEHKPCSPQQVLDNLDALEKRERESISELSGIKPRANNYLKCLDDVIGQLQLLKTMCERRQEVVELRTK